MNLKGLIFLSVCLLSSLAEARVFDFKNERFCSYLRYSYSPSKIAQTAFADSSGTGVTFDQTVKLNHGGEFGFVYSTPVVSFLFGFEALKTQLLPNIVGTDAAGTTLYTFSSDVSGYVPKLGMEFTFTKWSTSRIYLATMTGTATMTLQNSYKLTADGTAAFPTVVDFREEAQGTANLNEVGLGYEGLMSDTTTYNLELGYRTMNVAKFKHNRAVETFNGGVNKGDPLVNADGSSRSIDFGGYYGSITFRFYIQ